MYFLLKIGIFHCYVSLPEGTIWEPLFGSLFPSASEVNPRCVGPQNTCKRDHEEQNTKQKRNCFPQNKQTNKQTNKQNKQTKKTSKKKQNNLFIAMSLLPERSPLYWRAVFSPKGVEPWSQWTVFYWVFGRWGSIKKIKTTRDHWLDQINIPIQFLMYLII